ncbi:MAG: amino acid kinase family protein, partial [Candidatus Binataceae bacterium]
MSQVSYKQEFIARARRVVVKIGSAVVSDAGGLRPEIIARLAAEIDTIVRAGREVVVVTSGAIVAGRARLEKLGGSGVAARQAAAATGQIELMGEWARAF